jgi:hypothetical protein
VLLKDRLERFPAEIAVGGPESAGRWLRDPALFAWRGELPPGLAAAAEGGIAGEGISFARAPADLSAPESALEAVLAAYRAGESGPVAVPSGEILVRFGRGVRAEERGEDLAEAGYELSQVLAYAPHAAWVKARSGDPAEALEGLARLMSLAGVEHVEPQMLSGRAWK